MTAREVYLRYAPRSTAFRYLLAGDQVRRLVHWPSPRGGAWTGVEVLSGRWTPRGQRGWVLAGALAAWHVLADRLTCPDEAPPSRVMFGDPVQGSSDP